MAGGHHVGQHSSRSNVACWHLKKTTLLPQVEVSYTLHNKKEKEKKERNQYPFYLAAVLHCILNIAHKKILSQVN